MRRALVIVVGLALAACGQLGPAPAIDAHGDAALTLSDARVKDPCAAPIAVDDLGDCAARAVCAAASRCGLGDSSATRCEALARRAGNSLEVVPLGVNSRALAATIRVTEAAGRAIYDGDAAAACLAAFAAGSCKDVLRSRTVDPLADCALFRGKVADGDTCVVPYECRPGSACVYALGNFFADSCGLDVCRPRAALGEACATAPCATGDHCVAMRTGATGDRCTTGALGAACNFDGDCDAALRCNYQIGNRDDGAGTCVAASQVGGECSNDHQCAGELLCVGEMTALGQCRDVSTVGAACDDRCVGRLVCDADFAGDLGHCIAAPGIGDACSSSCGEFLRCFIDCEPLGDVGFNCNNLFDCRTDLYCAFDGFTGTCARPLPDGQGCTGDEQCASGACDSGFCGAPRTCPLSS
ncbi:MAG: hypothetical protein K8W52_19910 [Deltaproteobacteria bacterium]|nr:hypothetical protein [Deltaproteobacteria bacterium]